MGPMILIVDDEADIRKLVAGLLEDDGYQTLQAGRDEDVFDMLTKQRPDLVLLDIWLEGSKQDGLAILKTIKQADPDLPVIMMSGHGTIETAVSAIQDGAYDFIEKPFKTDRLLLMVKRAIEASRVLLERSILRDNDLNLHRLRLEGASAPYKAFSIALQAACRDVHAKRVWIAGEAGSGKDAAALALYEARLGQGFSGFYRFSCASASEADIRHFLLRVPQRSVLYFDQIEALSFEAQQALSAAMRVLDKDLVMIASCALSYEDEVVASGFMAELYHAFAAQVIAVPSLRDMAEDLPHFLKVLMGEGAYAHLPAEAVPALSGYAWPGNITQLENFAKFITPLLSKQGGFDIAALEAMLLGSGGVAAPNNSHEGAGLAAYMDYPLKVARGLFEGAYLNAQLERFDHNISKTAEFVGMDRAALHRKMKHLQSNADQESPADEIQAAE